ncbi:hypothetical protein G6F57_016655 [Rhizopus arrhizus]|nr:hypothetical protein G6F57_016655 [Rhizopus arrhizus]
MKACARLAAHQFGARVGFVAFLAYRARQQHARLHLGQDRGHHKVFGSKLEAQLAHHGDVFHVLPGDLGHGDVQHVQVLPADQVQQQVQRAFEGIQDDFQRVRRNVQVLRNLQDRLPMHHSQRHFLLLGGGRPGWRVRVEREFGSHLMDIRIATDQSRHQDRRAIATEPQGTRHAGIGAIPHISNSRTRRRERQRQNYGEVVYVARPGGPVLKQRDGRRGLRWPQKPTGCCIQPRAMESRVSLCRASVQPGRGRGRIG